MSPVVQIEIERLQRIVACQLSGRVRDFRLLADADGLILQGNASTYHAKQVAQHVIMQATRLPIVSNEIEVHVVCLDAQAEYTTQ